ncbi:MAG: chorismate synthase [Bacteroidales bacterium]|nr:chorismate synthase [Bacteroidales bacterium]
MFPYDSIGNELVVSLFGGSHSEFIGAKIEHFPSGVRFDASLLKKDIDRRRPQRYGTPRHESDAAEFLPVFKDGDFIPENFSFKVRNTNSDTSSYDANKKFFRPSHCDYVYYKKYGENSLKYKDEASGRITLPIVIAGSLCKMFLSSNRVTLHAEVSSPKNVEDLETADSIGGKITCRINNVPVGVGEPIFCKIQSMLAMAVMSIPSAVSFELGDGLKRTCISGIEDIDEWTEDNNALSPYFKTKTNHSGGVNAGISNGNEIVFHAGFHPVHTLERPVNMIDGEGRTEQRIFGGRHDKAHIFRLPVVVESLAAMVLTDLLLMKNKNNSDGKK